MSKLALSEYQIKKAYNAFLKYSGTVEDVFSRLPARYRKVLKPAILLGLHYHVLYDTPRWRVVRRWHIRRRGRELDAIVKPNYYLDGKSPF